MNLDIIVSFGKIAGIGGLSLAVFVLIFQGVVRKNIFARLDQEKSYQAIRMIILLTWAMALAGLAAWLYSYKYPKSEVELSSGKLSALFNAELKEVSFRRTANPGTIVQTHFQFNPKISNEKTTISIFYGFIEIYDADLVNLNEIDSKKLLCSEIKGCLLRKTYDDLLEDPFLLRGGEKGGTDKNWEYKIPNINNIIILWKFYQKETDDGGLCDVDKAKPYSSEIVPPLKVTIGKKIIPQGVCYFSRGHQTHAVPLI
jgi:hypothetical protein